MDEIIRVNNIRKEFPGVLAVDNVSFGVAKGEVLALMGENGAGKSTITKMIYGATKPDAGEIILEGKKQQFHSSHDASRAGIGMVYQELSVVGNLSVAENIFMNNQPVNKFNKIDWDRLNRETSEYLKKFRFDISPQSLVKKLSMGQQQLVEILKALSTNPRVLILDEPTSSLTDTETELLFENITKLKKSGTSFIYISHKLSEIFRIADRIVVLRDGKTIAETKATEVTERELITMMVGREIKEMYGKEHAERQISDKPYFEISGLSRGDLVKDVSFGLRPGEILGIAGLIGAGRTELAEAVFGACKKDAGSIRMFDREVVVNRPSDAIRNKIVYLTEDRKKLGLYLNNSIQFNLVAAILQKFTNFFGFVKNESIDAYSRDQIKKYSVACASINQKVLHLSGGNQQKCLISMWMGVEPDVIIFDEPTRGVDVGARAEIYEKIKEYVCKGLGAIVISSDLAELIGLCDRILVMHEGRITADIDKPNFTEERILAHAAGIE